MSAEVMPFHLPRQERRSGALAEFRPGTHVIAHGVGYVVCFVRGSWAVLRGDRGELRRLPLGDIEIQDRRNGDRRG
jgi:hypothetical protein